LDHPTRFGSKKLNLYPIHLSSDHVKSSRVGSIIDIPNSGRIIIVYMLFFPRISNMITPLILSHHLSGVSYSLVTRLAIRLDYFLLVYSFELVQQRYHCHIENIVCRYIILNQFLYQFYRYTNS
jgi:hypothetical protein